jgi:hypothetical protein
MLQNGYGDSGPPHGYAAKHAQTERFRRADVCEAQLNLRKTVDGGNGIYRIFEVSPSVFHVLDAGGRTVDEFKVVDCQCDATGVRAKKARRDKARLPGAPNLADSFVVELNAPRR